MTPPDASWTCDYRADRRGHHHRCRCCNRILKDGERAIMLRERHGCIAIHEACGSLIHSPGSPFTWAQAMAAWGREYNRRLGYRVEEPHPEFFGRAA